MWLITSFSYSSQVFFPTPCAWFRVLVNGVVQTGCEYVKLDIEIPFLDKQKFIDSFKNSINSKTKVIFLSHITSATALIFPVKEIIDLAKQKNILTIIDGAHVPAHIDLDIKKLDPDFYCGACHKLSLIHI